MKREIKCRFWYRGEWHYKTMFDTIPPEWEAEIDYSLVFEYTGLKDKNGKEIYEGDIMKVDKACNTIISWDVQRCGFIDNRDFDGDSFTIYDGFESLSEYEVIGNIYENPELL